MKALEQIDNPLVGRVDMSNLGFRLDVEAGELHWKSVGASGESEQFRNDKVGLVLTRNLECVGSAIIVRSTLHNPGDAPSPPINRLDPLCLVFNIPKQEWVHYHAHGGTMDFHVPPLAYRTYTTFDLAPCLCIQSHPAGCSSGLDLPLLISIADLLGAGLFCGMEWSGEWIIEVMVLSETQISLSARLKIDGLVLEPGESLELPPTHVGFFTGSFDEGTNALRRHIYQHVCHSYQGKPMLPKVSYDHWYGIHNRNTLDFLKTQVDRATELGVEIFVHDAAWFSGGFPNGVGNWDSVDKEKFPDGLEPLAEYVRSKGMNFGLWFEIERAAPGTAAVREHPEFFVKTDQTHWGWRRNQQFHLNLARPDAQDWAIETVSGWIERLDLHWSRWDYNINPNPFWYATDPTGKIQFAYMQGLYRVLDTLIKEHPNWMVEACAGGGRRIDLGTIRRAHTIWFSDQTHVPAMCRHMQARANRFLPGHLLNSSVMVDIGNGDDGFDDTAILSRMLGKLAFDGDIASWSPEWTQQVRHWTDAFKKLRHLFVQDFYQLTPPPSGHDDWDVMEFVNYDGSEAAVYAFADRSGGKQTIPLRGLVSNRNYQVTCLKNGTEAEFSGDELLSSGLPITLLTNEGRLWRVTW